MTEARRPASALATNLLLTVLFVLVGFASTLVYVFTILRPIEARAEAVLVNALPSARMLSLAQAALVEMEEAARPALLSTGDGTHVAAEIKAARNKLQAAVDDELATPNFPEEPALAAAILQSLEALDARTATLLASTTAKGEVRTAAAREWLAAAEVTDDRIGRLARVNLDGGVAEARTIHGTQQRAERVALAMFVGTLLGAAMAAFLTLRLLRQTNRDAALHERMLQDRADELEAFAGRVAHDLKDPLGGLSMRLGMIQTRARGDPEVLKTTVEKAVQQIIRMDAVVVSLLEFARAGGRPNLDAQADLHDAVVQVVEDIHPTAVVAQVDLSVDPFPTEKLACTPGVLVSVLQNLVGNSVKYVVEGKGPKHRVRLHVSAHAEVVRVEVKDNGPGLPRGTEATVFEPFVRLSQTRRAGTGLGLATVRRLVEGYGGRVGVDSEPGAGTCFWFEMPKARVTRNGIPERSPVLQPSATPLRRMFLSCASTKPWARA